MAGGIVAAKIARQSRRTAVLILAALVFVLGLAMAAVNAQREAPPSGDDAAAKIAKQTTAERAAQAVQPIGYSFALPFLAAEGVVVGGLGISRRRVRLPG
jgi:hypothetical protein